jgi:ATP-dependent DNA helicase RecG
MNTANRRLQYINAMTDRHQHAALADLENLINEPEQERLEFKEAKGGFSFDRLAKYCAALSNEGGGSIVPGVTDRRPRHIVGTHAFEEPGRTVAGLTDRLRIKIECTEVRHSDGRVLIFTAPPRPLGLPVQCDGIYWARAGDELRAMFTPELQRAFDEAGPDFSSEVHPSANLGDLNPALIDRFRAMWRKKSGSKGLDRLDLSQLLSDAELMVDGQLARISHQQNRSSEAGLEKAEKWF